MIGRMTSDPQPGALTELLRWVSAGGTWREEGRRHGWITVRLLQCDGAESQGLLRSDEEAFVAYVEEHRDEQA